MRMRGLKPEFFTEDDANTDKSRCERLQNIQKRMRTVLTRCATDERDSESYNKGTSPSRGQRVQLSETENRKGLLVTLAHVLAQVEKPLFPSRSPRFPLRETGEPADAPGLLDSHSANPHPP
jgi:hypothetical protein